MSKGFWITTELLHDKNTTMQEKFILVEIQNLSMLDKGCIASNEHFSELFKVKKEAISRSLNNLQKKGYITVEIKGGSRNHDRKIFINKMLSTLITKCLETKENKTTTLSNQLDYDAFLSTWNDYATKANKSKVAKLTDTRKKKILARSKDYKNLLDVFKYVLTKAEKSNFLSKGNFFSFDWLFTNDINMLKVYEGKYDNQELEEIVL